MFSLERGVLYPDLERDKMQASEFQRPGGVLEALQFNCYVGLNERPEELGAHSPLLNRPGPTTIYVSGFVEIASRYYRNRRRLLTYFFSSSIRFHRPIRPIPYLPT